MPLLGCVGYVANSVRTTARGTMSAGRLYDKVPEECAAVVRFITERSIIAEVLPNKQLHVQTQITLMDCVKDHRPKTHDWLL